MPIAVVVPTARYTTIYRDFLTAWLPLFERYQVHLITIVDGDDQHLECVSPGKEAITLAPEEVLGISQDLVLKHTPACRNLGFAYIAKELPEVDVILTLDDDVKPVGDPIGAHLSALSAKYPISWLSTTEADFHELKPLYMRGFPYAVREEAEAWVSVGIWLGVPDLDAPTQLVMGEHPTVKFYRGPIPRGIYAPICGMNVAFVRAALPYVYYAPAVTLPGSERMDDIFWGINLVDDMAFLNKAILTGFAAVEHSRASNVFANLRKEYIGIALNENYWQGGQSDPWFDKYAEMRKAWKKWVLQWL